MRIEVLEVVREATGDVAVKFRCSFGEGCGRWTNTALQPEESCEYSAELDIECTAVLGQSARPGSQGVFSIAEEWGLTSLNGVVEGRDPDGMLYFRLSDYCLTMIESEGENGTGMWLRLIVDSRCIELYAQR